MSDMIHVQNLISHCCLFDRYPSTELYFGKYSASTLFYHSTKQFFPLKHSYNVDIVIDINNVRNVVFASVFLPESVTMSGKNIMKFSCV